MALAPHPGLRKAAFAPSHISRNATFVRSEDAHWRDAFGQANILSEGKTEAGSYQGTTSIVLQIACAANDLSSTDPRTFLTVQLAEHCMHVRLRALRIARREAQHRAGRSLHPSRCDMQFLRVPGGVKIEVSVEAKVVERRTRARNGT
jgi:hypothetical protein